MRLAASRDCRPHARVDSAARGHRYLFVAIDRTSKLVLARLEKEATRQSAADVLRFLVEVVPCQNRTVLTGNGIQLGHPPRYRSDPNATFSTHLFHRVCRDNDTPGG